MLFAFDQQFNFDDPNDDYFGCLQLSQIKPKSKDSLVSLRLDILAGLW